MNILITAGGTREYIDGVRYIGNSSSGQTAAQLTDYLLENGHDVVWLGAVSAVSPQLAQQVECHRFETFDDLQRLLQQQLASQSFDMVFQAAAVSDYKINAVSSGSQVYKAGRDYKIPTHDSLQVELSKRPKLVNSLKQWSANKQISVVAFKLTNTQDSDQRHLAVQRILAVTDIDAVAHNDLNFINLKNHPFTLHIKNRSPFNCDDITAVARVLMTLQEMQ